MEPAARREKQQQPLLITGLTVDLLSNPRLKVQCTSFENCFASTAVARACGHAQCPIKKPELQALLLDKLKEFSAEGSLASAAPVPQGHPLKYLQDAWFYGFTEVMRRHGGQDTYTANLRLQFTGSRKGLHAALCRCRCALLPRPGGPAGQLP